MSHLTNDPFVAFLYELTRDHVDLGVVRDIVGNDAKDEVANGPRWRLMDGTRARRCVDLAAALRRRNSVSPVPPPSKTTKA